ncbi:hypothetical protein CMQ_7801 [Grosmannia clavigera kw1407]|uniref:C6 zinc finger domain containing protein n=1 Tax=Grosmannia clavigera (strain kw1407 / UAMH 11150) TaxID=655863 RepID=F0XRW3_GROCL|nr:uncharacterized protein CMQ_7801 [Grosmannia clavigera kw1407]EFW99433.1 hypothetical protein CMQ_7801 [Grosmannia clavigera kw1407]
MPRGRIGKVTAARAGRERGKPRRLCLWGLSTAYRVGFVSQRRRASNVGRRATETATETAISKIAEDADRVSSMSPPLLINSDGSETWSETDENSLVKRLAALCSHILTAEDSSPANSRHEQHDRCDHYDPCSEYKHALSPETTCLLSDLCMFIQARLEGRDAPIATGSSSSSANGTFQSSESPESLDMVRHRLAVLANLNKAIEAANPLAFLGIATFAVLEVCDTTFGEWKCHLYGARYVLDYHRCQSMADLHRLARFVPGLLDILARLVWFDICGAIVRGADADADAGLIFEDWHRQVLDHAFFSTIGCPADTCALYVDVARSQIACESVRSCLRVTEQVLKLQTRSERSSGWDVCADVNRCAAALAVLVQVPDSEVLLAESREATAAAVVERLCETLAATSSSSPFYIHMALGAYLAGMHARTDEQCRTVRQYWLNCNLSGISRYPGGLARCEAHWRKAGLLASSVIREMK